MDDLFQFDYLVLFNKIVKYCLLSYVRKTWSILIFMVYVFIFYIDTIAHTKNTSSVFFFFFKLLEIV